MPLTPGQPPVTLAVPANSPEEAFYLLYHIGNGTTGAFAHGTVIQVLRDQYKSKLTQVEAQILQRSVALGPNATEHELRGLAQWGARQHANTARLFRLPTPAVGTGLTRGDLAVTTGRHIVFDLNAAQRAELAGLAARQ